MKNFKTYLGDGVYVDFDGYYIQMYLNDGIEDHSTILLEPAVMDALFHFKERIDDERRKHLPNNP